MHIIIRLWLAGMSAKLHFPRPKRSWGQPQIFAKSTRSKVAVAVPAAAVGVALPPPFAADGTTVTDVEL